MKLNAVPLCTFPFFCGFCLPVRPMLARGFDGGGGLAVWLLPGINLGDAEHEPSSFSPQSKQGGKRVTYFADAAEETGICNFGEGASSLPPGCSLLCCAVFMNCVDVFPPPPPGLKSSLRDQFWLQYWSAQCTPKASALQCCGAIFFGMFWMFCVHHYVGTT